MTTEDDIAGMMDAGIDSMEVREMLAETLRTTRAVDRRTTMMADEQVRIGTSVVQLEVSSADHAHQLRAQANELRAQERRLASVEASLRRASLHDADVALRDRASSDYIARIEAQGRQANYRSLAMLAAALLGLAARFFLGGH